MDLSSAIDGRRNIAIALPARDQCETMFVFDLCNEVSEHKKTTDDGMVLVVSQGTLLASQRHALVLEARRENATHILWLDSDMRFPVGTIKRLLAHEQYVVGANCAKRRIPTGPTAANYDPETKRKIPVFTEEDSTGLERVDALGTGVLLVDMRVFDEIPAPWFQTPWIEEHMNYQGEDIYFARLLKSYGIPLFVDHDLSKDIGHLGQFEFRHEHTRAERDRQTMAAIAAQQPYALAVEA